MCDLCSSNRAPLEYKKNQPDRVCDQCYESLYCAIESRIQDENVADDKDAESATNVPTDDYSNDEHGKHCNKKPATLSELKRIKQSFKKGIRDSMRNRSQRKPDRLLEVSLVSFSII